MALPIWAFTGRLLHPEGSDVLVITVDTLRADHLSCYGGATSTPSIDRLASEGALFETSWTNVPRTTPAVASLMTGRFAHHHGVRRLRQRLPDGEETLAERLSEAGFRTGALVAGGPLERVTGLDRGFSSYRCYVDLKGMLLTLRAVPWILRNVTRRTFLWVHYFDPHFGYQPPWPYNRVGTEPEGFSVFEDIRSRRLRFGELYFKPPLSPEEHSYLQSLYRGEVEYTDAAVGLLLAAVRVRDWITGTRTLIILTADHGESLGEHGCWYEHGEFLYEQDLRIPLIVSWPGRIPAGVRTTSTSEMIDLAPTILDLLGLPPLGAPDGRSLVPFLEGGVIPPKPLFAESGESMFEENPRRPVRGVAGKWRSVRRADWKLILIPHGTGEQIELFDLAEDPLERNELSAQFPGKAAELRGSLLEWMASPRTRPDEGPEMDDETRERLRSLGYVD
jgi:arylsulfatase A-like enzyme